MDAVAVVFGYVVLCGGGTVVIAGLLIAIGAACRKAQWMLVDAYGGWQTFAQFRDWYHTSRYERALADRRLRLLLAEARNYLEGLELADRIDAELEPNAHSASNDAKHSVD